MKPILRTAYMTLILCGLLFSYGNAAHAQVVETSKVAAVDAGAVDTHTAINDALAAPVVPEVPPVLPAPPQDDLSLLRQAYEGIVRGDSKWRAFAVFLLIGVVYMTRRYGGSPIPLLNRPFLPQRLYTWFNTDRGGVVLVFLLASMGALGHALASNASLSFAVMENAIKLGISAAGTYVMSRRIINPPDKKEGNP